MKRWRSTKEYQLVGRRVRLIVGSLSGKTPPGTVLEIIDWNNRSVMMRTEKNLDDTEMMLFLWHEGENWDWV